MKEDAPSPVESRAIAREAADAALRLLPHEVERGVLYIVSTPIGHLGDISLRALAVLQQVERILCEDTRHVRPLLDRYGIATAVAALHEHNEAKSVPALIAQLTAGETLALVSDAGTPLVSDPGARLVEGAIDAGIRVVAIPGASAALAALVSSGLPAHPSTILGFLPRKGGERREVMEQVVASPHTVVLYESPHRVVDTLRALADAAGGSRHAAVARELTKHFEEVKRGTLDALITYYEVSPPRGEVVLLVSGREPAPPADTDTLESIATALRNDGQSQRDIMDTLMQQHGAPRNVAYKIAHTIAKTMVLCVILALGMGSALRTAHAQRLAIARLQYDGGGDWYANPSSLPNLRAAVVQHTALPVEQQELRVRLTDPELATIPFVHATGHGEMVWSEAERAALRRYLLSGGFLHVDDNYGLDESVRREVARLFPDRPLVEVPLSHPIYHVVYDMEGGLPKIHEHDGKPAQGLGVFIGNRLALYYSVSTDLGNGWEDIGTHPNDPPELHERALRMGVNLFVYAVTSRATP